MSEEENKFDQLIQDKFAAKDFPFDEENWERAEVKMESDRKRKKFLWISLVFLIGLTAGVSVMLPFINTGQPETKMIVQVEQKNEPSMNPLSEEKKVADKKDVPIKVLAENDFTVHRPGDGKNKENVFAKEQSSPIVSSPVKKKDHVDAKAKEPLVSHDDHSFTSDKKSTDDPSTKKYTKNIEPAPFADVNDADNKKIYGMIKLDSSDMKKIEPENNSTPVFPKKDSLHDEKIKDLVNNGIVHPEDSAPIITQVPPKDSVSGKTDPNLKKPPVEPISQPSAQKLASTNIFSIDAGTNFLFGWTYGKDTNGLEGRGFNPILGFGFTHYMNKKWSFNSGIQYGSIGYLHSQKIFSSATPDFGLTKNDTIINTRWIHAVVVPFFVHYTINNKNSIGIGGTFSYLINTTSDYIIDTRSDFKEPIRTSVRSFGYMQGLNMINATAAIAYRRRISDKISITAEVHYGLMDIKNDDFFNKQKIERSSGIKLTLSYSIFNH